eukprot:CAMPEP_0198280758 /NCGR_PEP_ID=MMETSP1449-20131203/786_1 /TAXON_ID=420275 /ORGANISM="Attheya septentrionalis, Strain CCMP2084" /LENGTH=210 /DNA_ID=CAMNT_0043976229 /DNA_START=238 /DNA_END=870 /DNA_ORIENTATION=-
MTRISTSSMATVVAVLLSVMVSPVDAFATGRTSRTAWMPSSVRQTSASSSSSSLDMMDLSAMTSASMLVSTIDSDIANISDDRFGLVFAGGIAVMVGGVLSALAVGALLEGGNNYAQVVGESYAQSGDEEFWAKLTPEQKEQTEALIRKLRESKGQGVSADDLQKIDLPSLAKKAAEEDPDSTATTPTTPTPTTTTAQKEKPKESLFSDY